MDPRDLPAGKSHEWSFRVSGEESVPQAIRENLFAFNDLYHCFCHAFI